MFAWITPTSAASGEVVAVIRIPDSLEARAQLRGFLFDCTQAENYEQIDDDSLTPAEAAAEWQQALDDWCARITCDDV